MPSMEKNMTGKFLASLIAFTILCDSAFSAMQTSKGYIPIPPRRFAAASGAGATINFATLQTLDATTDRCAFIFKVPNGATTISTVGFRIGTVAGGSGSVDVDVRLETVDATTGDPSGTLWATNTNANANIAFNADNSWIEVTLTASATVTPDDDIAIVLNPTTFTTVTSVVISGGGSGDTEDFSSYNATNNGGAGYVKSTTNAPFMAIGNGTTYFPIAGTMPIVGVNATAYNSGSATNKRALKFQVPFKTRCVGGYVEMDRDADVDIKLYDSDGTTVLGTASLDSDIDSQTATVVYSFFFNTSANIAANTNYYMSFEPTTVTNISFNEWSANSNALLDGFPGGKNFFLSTNNGSWNDDNTSQPFAGIYVDQFDDGAGGAGANATQAVTAAY